MITSALAALALGVAACPEGQPVVQPPDAGVSEISDASNDVPTVTDVAPDIPAAEMPLPDVAADTADVAADTAYDAAPDVPRLPDATLDVVPDAPWLPDASADVAPELPELPELPPQAMCPPAGPYGHAAGETLTNYTLFTCDGQPVDLHSICGADAGLIFNYYGW